MTRLEYERADRERRLHERIRWRCRLGRSRYRNRTDWEAWNWGVQRAIMPYVQKAIFQSSPWLGPAQADFQALEQTRVNFRWKHYFASLRRDLT